MSELEVSDSYRYCLKASVSAICTDIGFSSADPAALDTLTELTFSLLMEMGRTSRSYCELAGRVEPIPADIILAMVELGVPIGGLKDYMLKKASTSITPPGQAPEIKNPTILHTGNRKRHPGHIPEHMPELPDSHSYIHTPTHRQPITDYESVREKAASQKRDVERALTRFIAKTGNIHNLFNSEDTNLFPLISCVKGEDEFKLPPYVDALIFKDQIFEEEEIERRPRKKKFERAEEDEDDDEDPIGDRSLRLNESIAESETGIENPFLRQVRLPRTPKKQRD